MRAIVLGLMLAGCADDVPPRDPHAVVTCTNDDGTERLCEIACKEAPDVLDPNATCRTRTILCTRVFDFDGIEGCCLGVAPKPAPEPEAIFLECI